MKAVSIISQLFFSTAALFAFAAAIYMPIDFYNNWNRLDFIVIALSFLQFVLGWMYHGLRSGCSHSRDEPLVERNNTLAEGGEG